MESPKDDTAVVVLSDDPRLSSAVLSIRFQRHACGDVGVGGDATGHSKNDDDEIETDNGTLALTTKKTTTTTSTFFRPEYTHQIVGMEERFSSSYQPYQSVIDAEIAKFQQNQNNNNIQSSTSTPLFLLHKSHRHHDTTASHEIDINISISPSCQRCNVDIHQRLKGTTAVTASNDNNNNNNSMNKRRSTTIDGVLSDRPVAGGVDGGDGQLKISNHSNSSNENNHDDEPQWKRPKLTAAATSTEEPTSENVVNRTLSTTTTTTIDPQQQRQHQEDEAYRPITTSQSSSSLSNSEIRKMLSKALPTIVGGDDGNNNHSTSDFDNDENEDEDGYLRTPIGDILEEYEIPITTNHGNDDDRTTTTTTSSKYVISLADGRNNIPSSCSDDNNNQKKNVTDVRQFHNNVQRLALWYIENADDVNVSDESTGGYWKVLYLFQKHPRISKLDNEYRYSLVGYMTLYHFISLFHKPTGGIIVRICQALLLPPYQGQGHGGRMIRAVYNLAATKTNVNGASSSSTTPRHHHEDDTAYDIVQINVEDPAPGFVALRNKTDFCFVLDNMTQWKTEPNWPHQSMSDPFEWEPMIPSTTTTTTDVDVLSRLKSTITGMMDNNNSTTSLLFGPLSEKDALHVSAISKLTIRQIHIVREILVLWKTGCYVDLDVGMLRGDGTSTQKPTSSSLDVNCDDDAELHNLKMDLFKKARLMMKKRLNKEHRDELTALPTKNDQKRELSNLFDKQLDHYLKILRKKK